MSLRSRARVAHTGGAGDRDTLNVSAHRESQTRGRAYRRVRPAGRIGLAERPARAPRHLQPGTEGSARAACRRVAANAQGRTLTPLAGRRGRRVGLGAAVGGAPSLARTGCRADVGCARPRPRRGGRSRLGVGGESVGHAHERARDGAVAGDRVCLRPIGAALAARVARRGGAPHQCTPARARAGSAAAALVRHVGPVGHGQAADRTGAVRAVADVVCAERGSGLLRSDVHLFRGRWPSGVGQARAQSGRQAAQSAGAGRRGDDRRLAHRASCLRG